MYRYFHGTSNPKIMLVTFSLIHNRKGKLREDGTAVVQVRAYHNKKHKYFSTGVNVEPKFWDEKRNQVSQRHPNNVSLNLHLQNFMSEFEGYQRGFLAQDKTFDLRTLQECVSGVKTTLLYDFISRETENDVKLKEKSKVALRNTLVKLKAFRPAVVLVDVDFQFLEDFDNHLRSTGLAQNTIHKQHKNLKRFLNLAIKSWG